MAILEDLLMTAEEAARAGAGVVREARRSGRAVSVTAKAANDFVTEVDREAEAAIVSTIRSRFPEHGILAEESASTDPGGEYRWIIDPLDGTTNFIHGFPAYSVSVAAAKAAPGPPAAADLMAGVIVDPIREETFRAVKGGGAFLGEEPIRTSTATSLEESLLLTGFPFRAQDLLETYLKIFADLHRTSQGIRRAGSAAMDLAYTACGRAEGFFEFALSPWDVAAGSLLVMEAGGTVRDFEGGTDYLESGHIVAGAPGITEKLLQVVRRHYP